jgi:radical SAM protein with 4Fe4S-binding SPASM domain
MDDQEYTVRRSAAQLPLWQGKGPRLGALDIELTERCNNACQHCYINLPAQDISAQARELSTAQWQDILCQAAALGALSVRFTGGEPLLREDFTELYLFARRLGLKVLLFTNGRCITPALADLFARVPPLEKIEITAYGMHPKSYDAAACCQGAYAEFRRGVDLLLERSVPFTLKGALLPPNQGEVEELEAWAAELPWMKEPPGYALLFDLRARRDSAARSRRIAVLRLPPEQVLAMLTRRPSAYRKSMRQFCTQFSTPPGASLFSCGAGQGGCVDAYGLFQPCMLLRDPSFAYDLRTGTLQDALDTFFPRLREIQATNPVYLERCAKCFLKGLCEQCPAKSWMEHGTLDTPIEYLCQVAHAQAIYLNLLSPGEHAWEIEDWPERIRRLAETQDE